jgi:hypothetical protein
VHDCAENKRRDHHTDQLNERVAERLHRLAGIGKKYPTRTPIAISTWI